MYLQNSTLSYLREIIKQLSIMGFLFPIPDVHTMHFEALGLRDASYYDVIDLVSSDKEVVEEEPTMALLAEEEEEEEDVLMPPLEVEEEQHVYMGPTEGDEMQQGVDVPVPPHEVTDESFNG